MRKFFALMAALFVIYALMVSCAEDAAPGSFSPSLAGEQSAEYTSSLENSSSQAPPAQILPGFKEYILDERGLKLQYPEKWTVIDKTSFDADNPMLNAALEYTGVSKETMLESLEASPVTFYDFPGKACLIVGVEPSGGIGQDAMDSYAFTIRTAMENQASMLASISGFKWLEEPAAGDFGENRFAFFSTAYSVDGVPSASYQAVTVNTGKLYRFSYVQQAEVIAPESVKQIQQILSTVTLY
ncbi:MAG: hypothetical protein LBC56_00275 [Oscillospiraceae bacterium]|jgi:hypothetical protein|nr:hypothetical protein [Oscillospiraceae bacterium]